MIPACVSIIIPLIATAAFLGFFHTVVGPDHYVPFIVMGKARKWTRPKTMQITLLCGIGHVGSSVVIGLVGLFFGAALITLIGIESFRGDIAAWAILLFGLTYFVYSLHRELKGKRHTHAHVHLDGEEHEHDHDHNHDHAHVHTGQKKNITPWVLFTVFVLGPCEPLIPLLIYPAATVNVWGIVGVVFTFSIVTIATMMTMVYAATRGLELFPTTKLEKHVNSIAGATIALCGLAILAGL